MLQGAFDPLIRLIRHTSFRRRRQLVLQLVLMVLGAFAELVSLGAVLPFLVLLSDPEKISDYSWLEKAMTLAGCTSSSERLVLTTILFSCAALGAGAIRVGQGWSSSRLVFLLGHDLTLEVFKRIIYQPYGFFVARNSSEIIAAFNKVQLITGRVLLAIMNVLSATALSIFILLALLVIDARTALIAGAGFGLIYLTVSYSVRRRLLANSISASAAQAQRIQCFQEAVGSVRNVLLDDAQELYIRKLRVVDVPLRNAEAATALISIAPRYIVEASSMVLIAVIAYNLTREPGAMSAALPTLGALALGAQKLLPLLQQIYLGWVAAAANWAVLNDVLELLQMPIPAEYSKNSAVSKLSFEQSIALHHVNFRYNDSEPLVLNDVNLMVAKGSRCGIIGRSGGGKSTLIDVVMGLLQPTSGELRVDSVAITADNRRTWQARIAHVPQAIYLSDASLAENIALGVEKERIDMQRVRDAARQAQLDDFVNSQPEGFDTLVGERGIRLSGGQRQRVAIARALYKRADVLILDEATSALDDETERAVVECIDGLDENLTIFIIAHRLSTVRNCDLVLRLEAGSIAARGRYEDVVGLASAAEHGSVNPDKPSGQRIQSTSRMPR